ncbi:MAG: PFL_4669 family integrating conjugative element protein [Halioglobus sp.]
MKTGCSELSTLTTPTPSSAENSQPNAVGPLSGEACLEVHSHQAQRLIWGRRRTAQKPPISGLIAFASALTTIWQAVESGDPYALWWLIKVEAGIEGCRVYLNKQLEQASFLFPDPEILSVDTAESEQPYRIRLAFSNPYPYRAAHVLGEYDMLVRICHSLIFVGAALPVELHAVVAHAGRQVRRLLAIPQSFKVCQVNRDDIRQHNQRAERAVQLMGLLPAEILTGEILPTFIPAGVRLAQDSRSKGMNWSVRLFDSEKGTSNANEKLS